MFSPFADRQLTDLDAHDLTGLFEREVAEGHYVEYKSDLPKAGKIAKSVFEEMFKTGKSAREIVEASGQTQISDEGELLEVVRRVISENERIAADFRGGKERSLGFLVGQVMKHTDGRANPGLVNTLLRRELQQVD